MRVVDSTSIAFFLRFARLLRADVKQPFRRIEQLYRLVYHRMATNCKSLDVSKITLKFDQRGEILVGFVRYLR